MFSTFLKNLLSPAIATTAPVITTPVPQDVNPNPKRDKDPCKKNPKKQKVIDIVDVLTSSKKTREQLKLSIRHVTNSDDRVKIERERAAVEREKMLASQADNQTKMQYVV